MERTKIKAWKALPCAALARRVLQWPWRTKRQQFQHCSGLARFGKVADMRGFGQARARQGAAALLSRATDLRAIDDYPKVE
jgi:hypothetical protein